MTDITDLYEALESVGIDRDRLEAAIESKDNWGTMVHAFEYLVVLGLVMRHWPEEEAT